MEYNTKVKAVQEQINKTINTLERNRHIKQFICICYPTVDEAKIVRITCEMDTTGEQEKWKYEKKLMNF